MDLQNQFQAALELHGSGQIVKAKEYYEKIISQDPFHANCLQNLGIIHVQEGDLNQAINYFTRAVEVDPQQPSFLNNLGTALNDLGRFLEAIPYFERAIKINLDFADAYYNLGNALQKSGQFEKSIECYKQAIRLSPAWAEAYLNCGNSFNLLGDFDQALECYDAIIRMYPFFAVAHLNRGHVLTKLNLKNEALKAYEIASKFDTSSCDAYIATAETLCQRGEFHEAIIICQNAIRLKPFDARLHYQIAISYFQIRDLNLAVENFKKAINLKHDYAEAYNGLGISLAKAHHFQEAQENFSKALEISPDFVMARVNSGDAYFANSDIPSALAQFQKLKPENQPLGLIQFFKQRLCDWGTFDTDHENLIKNINRPRVIDLTEDPWHLLRISNDPQLIKEAAQNFVKTFGPGVENVRAKALKKNSKIKIGYFSADFRDHAVTHLALELFGLHDRSKFEVHAFAFGRQCMSGALYEKILKAFDFYHSVNDKNDTDLAKFSQDLGIDIAFDLSGITSESRLGVFANRAAPIQINFLGFTSTLGTQYHDYIIADPVIIPNESRGYYTEKVVHLPCMMPYDTRHNLSTQHPTRVKANLPERGFIFSAYNQCFKITPTIWRLWMNILKKVPDSYLWLSTPYERLAITNLRKEAERQGVSPNRIIFAERIQNIDEHLARISLADLFLDTFPYNAHTSAIDSLWAGVPIITKIGNTFASRLASSLLKSVGLDDLIVKDDIQYEMLAIDLALNHEKLKIYRKKLQDNRKTHGLFNMKAYTRNLEKAITKMYEDFHKGLAVDHITIQ